MRSLQGSRDNSGRAELVAFAAPTQITAVPLRKPCARIGQAASPLTGKVVLDAMGSDHAPHAEIDGALAAARDFGISVILVGQPEVVEPELRRCGWRGDGDKGIELVEAAEVIGMDERSQPPFVARRKAL